MKEASGGRDSLHRVQRKTRRRLLFSGVVLVLYFSFVLNWTSSGAVLRESLPGLSVTGSLLMFVLLVVVLILLELLFLALGRDSEQAGD
jgi:hypothetical protein